MVACDGGRGRDDKWERWDGGEDVVLDLCTTHIVIETAAGAEQMEEWE